MVKQSAVLAPRRLFVQILELQLCYYAIGLVLITFTLVVSGIPFEFDYVFSWKPVRADTTLGWVLSLIWLLDTFFSVLAMTVIVGRSRLALDFSLTLHGIDILVVWLVSRQFPRSWLWWGVQFVSSISMICLGTWTTQWRELQRTFFEDYELADIERSQRGAS